MLRSLLVAGSFAVLAVLPANAAAAGLWTERVVGDAPPGLLFGESFSLTPDGLGIFAVATGSALPPSPVTLIASTVQGGLPGPLVPVGGLSASGTMKLVAAGPGSAALVVIQPQDGVSG